jgi:DNA-binding CsgD family transcriptional regulator
MDAAPVDGAHLTGRERDVLTLLADGLLLEEIAKQLGIGVETVRTHLRKASERLEATNRTHAVAIAIRQGLI